MGLLIRAPEWVLWSLGGAAGVAGLFIVLWGLAWDRAKGRRRCGRCWYDMAGTPGLRCPECGREATGEKGLLKTRRRPAIAMLGSLIMLIGVAFCTWPIVRQRGAPGLLPTFVLVRLTPAVGKEWWLDPVQPKWITSSIATEIDRRAKANNLSPSNWLTAFQTAGVLKCRSKWPKDRPFVVGLSMPYVWAGFAKLELVPRTPGLRTVSAGEASVIPRGGCGGDVGNSWQDADQHQILGMLPAGTTKLEFDVRLSRRPDGANAFTSAPGSVKTVSLGVWRIPIELVDTPEQALPIAPVRDASADNLSVEVARDRPGWRGGTFVHIFGAIAPESCPSRGGVGILAELVHLGKVEETLPVVIRESDFVLHMGNAMGETERSICFEFPGRTLATLPVADLNDWTIRLTPSAEALLECWDVGLVTGRTQEFKLTDCWK